jgi:hypothetical protein
LANISQHSTPKMQKKVKRLRELGLLYFYDDASFGNISGMRTPVRGARVGGKRQRRCDGHLAKAGVCKSSNKTRGVGTRVATSKALRMRSKRKSVRARSTDCRGVTTRVLWGEESEVCKGVNEHKKEEKRRSLRLRKEH